MLISTPIYFISTKERPFRFSTVDANDAEDLKEAAIFFSEEDAKMEIQTYDEPDKYQVIKGKIEVDL